MENVTKIFGPIVPMFFTVGGGVSLSEINRTQAEHKQKNDMFWGAIADGTAGIFQKVLTFVGAGSNSPQPFNGERVTEEQILGYKGVAARNAQVANLMHALKLHKSLQLQLERMDLTSFVTDVLPVAPTMPPSPKRGTACDTDSFMDLTNIDEMIANLKPEVLTQFDLAFFQRANELNSRAAAIGKLLSEQGAFFRELVKAVPRNTELPTNYGVVVTQWKRTYGPEDISKFETLRHQLQEEYNDLQRQLNGHRKQIKDAVRAYNLGEQRQYQALFGQYRIDAEKHALAVEKVRSDAETLRQQALQETAALRVRTE